MKKVLVTGANGFIGSLLVEELIQNGVEVIAADLMNHNNKIPIGVRFVDFDMHNCTQLEKKISDRDIDAVFHMAWAGSSGLARGDYSLQLDNVKCTCDMVQTAANMKIERFVGAGTIKQMDCLAYVGCNGASPNLIHNYGAAKISAHFMSKSVANSKNLKHIWCLFPSVYGVGDTTTNFVNTTLNKVLAGEHAEFTDGEQNCDFVYISDMIHGLFLCGENGRANCTYYIGSGKARQLKEYIKIIYHAVDSEIAPKLGEVEYSGVSLPLEVYDCKVTFEDTGYLPKVSFQDGIMKTIDWIKQQNKEKENV